MIRRHDSATSFLQRAETWLLENEAEHNLVLGLAHKLQGGAAEFDAPIYLATVEHEPAMEREGVVVGCAFRTPPFKMGLTRMPDEAVSPLVADVAEVYAELPAVLGPGPQARAFARLWSDRRGIAARDGMRQRIYQLENVVPPRPMAPGHLRDVTPGEADLIGEWISQFSVDAGVEHVVDQSVAQTHLTQRSIYVWEHEEPRCMAALAGETPNGARIGFVYTPPEWRGRGYASASTAELSQKVLDSGRRFCFLYTDLSNPSSNAIYQRIGYRPVCDVLDCCFAPTDAAGDDV